MSYVALVFYRLIYTKKFIQKTNNPAKLQTSSRHKNHNSIYFYMYIIYCSYVSNLDLLFTVHENKNNFSDLFAR